MLILNCGGTFNKRYNEISGELEVPYDNYAVEKILDSFNEKYDLAGVIYKDSLEMDINDRKMLASIIIESTESTFIIIHGTDTMSQSAEFLDEVFDDRKIILVGAMKPFEIDNIEATLNLGIAIGFSKSVADNGVYICMNGYAEEWNKLNKNTKLGKFELVQ
ncbi:MAG: asparaginase domain-containing protein [Campylobacterota bacterium]|nr:asparaginase domain-containing protein [Campylobacterota bacterium]